MSNLVFYNISLLDYQAVPFIGDAPYIHWFNEPVSTGQYGTLTVVFKKTDNNNSVVKIELLDSNSNIFKILDPEVISNDLVTSSIINIKPDEKTGFYQFIVIGRADTAGEYIGDILIDGYLYKFGFQSITEDERLSINLINKGIELPESVSRALADTYVYDHKPAWTQLNSKFKELLINFRDTIDNKGSYRSLLNSLLWFGYGDLVELREVWKYNTPDGPKMFDLPVQDYILDDPDKLFNTSKTTSFVLRALYDRIESDMLIEYEMKMFLLGYFYYNYFMPIHTELDRSVIERVYYSDENTSIQMGWSGTEQIHEECFSETGDFDLEWEIPGGSGNGSGSGSGTGGSGTGGSGTGGQTSNLELALLEEIHVISGIPNTDVPFFNCFENIDNIFTQEESGNLQYLPIIACHTLDEINTDITNLSHIRSFNGIGQIALAKMNFPEKVLSGKCITNITGNDSNIELNYIESDPNHYSDSFTIKFLFTQTGIYNMLLKFTGISGKSYTKQVNINIIDNIIPDFDILILKSLVSQGQVQPNPFELGTSIPNKFMFVRDKMNQNMSGYNVYIPVSSANSDNPEAPIDAPTLTELYVIEFEDYSKIESYIKTIENDCWIRTGQSMNQSWIQYIYKVRGHLDPDFYIKNIPGSKKRYIKELFIPELTTTYRPEAKESINARFYPVVCLPYIKLCEPDENRKVPYSKYAPAANSKPGWEFFSWNLQRDISDHLGSDVREPFVAWTRNKIIPPGYYTINFSYKFGSTIKTISRNTPFKLI